MKIVVTGYREAANVAGLFEALYAVKAAATIDHVGVGDARGPDSWTQTWCLVNNIPYTTFRANWKEFPRRAGIIRNQLMIDLVRPDLVIAVLHPLSRGARHCARYARSLGIEVQELWEGVE